MYKIIGADRKEYGPETADQVRDWIAEGRANGQTLARSEESPQWAPLSSYPEFAAALAAAPQPRSSPAPFPGATRTWPGQVAAGASDFDLAECFNRGGFLLRDNFGLFIGATSLIWLLFFIPLVRPILGGPLLGGLYLVYLKRIRNEPATVADAFSGFGPLFPHLFLAGFLSLLLSGIGYFFCFVPGIYLQVAWIFGVALVADKRLEFWTAMELSRKTVSRCWFKVLALLIIAFAPLMVFEAFVMIKTWILIKATVMPAWDGNMLDFPKLIQALVPVATTMRPLILLAQFILLLNMPFGLAVMMSAYENLFGTRAAPTS